MKSGIVSLNSWCFGPLARRGARESDVPLENPFVLEEVITCQSKPSEPFGMAQVVSLSKRRLDVRLDLYTFRTHRMVSEARGGECPRVSLV